MNSNELFSDIVSYAPDLAMITNDDDTTMAQNKISMHDYVCIINHILSCLPCHSLNFHIILCHL